MATDWWLNAYDGWYGPWPIEEAGLHNDTDPLAGWQGRDPLTTHIIHGWLCMDHYGDLFAPGTFFVTARRFFLLNRRVELDDTDGSAGGGNPLAWDNGDLIHPDRDTVLVLDLADAFLLAELIRNAGDYAGRDYGTGVQTVQHQCGDGLTVVVQVEPSPTGGDCWVNVAFSDHTAEQPWTFDPLHAGNFAARLEMLAGRWESYREAAA